MDQVTPQPVVKTLIFPPDVSRDEFGVARWLTANPATKTIAIGYNSGVGLWRIERLDRRGIWVRAPEGTAAVIDLTANLSFSPDGKYLAVAANEGDVAVWDLSEEEPKLITQSSP